MPLDNATIAMHLDQVLIRYGSSPLGKGDGKNLSGSQHVFEWALLQTQMREALNRYAPDGYGAAALGGCNEEHELATLAGVVQSLRDDYRRGELIRFQARIRAEVFSDFLERAEYYIEDEGQKGEAAWTAGIVLEQHLRKLCDKHGVTIPPKATIDPRNAALYKANVYNTNWMKQVTAWGGLRNSAAHGALGEFTAEQVRAMIQGIRLFLAEFPA